MFKYTGMTAKEVRDNLRGMQDTSITFINENEKIEEFIVLIPRIEFFYGKNKVQIDLYSKIAQLIIDVKKNYTMINTKTLMSLKNKHSVRMLPILNMIDGFKKTDPNKKEIKIPKRKDYKLNSLNDIFGTKYKRLVDIERFILKPVKEELDSTSNITFTYLINTENLGTGRPKATSITIDVVTRNSYQGKLL